MAELLQPLRVILTTRSSSKYEGILHSMDQATGQIVLRNVKTDGRSLVGSIQFYNFDLIDFEYVNEGDNQNMSSKQNLLFLKCPKAPRPTTDKMLKAVRVDEKTVDIKPKKDIQFLDTIDEDFYKAVDEISSQFVISVNFDGSNLGRSGRLSLIEIGTEKKTYVFDILTLGKEVLNSGLNEIFMEPKITKVIHDCRFLSDMLSHQYNTEIQNVFDTQVASAFIFRANHDGEWPKHVGSLKTCLKSHLPYLKEEDTYFFTFHESAKELVGHYVSLAIPAVSGKKTQVLNNLIERDNVFRPLPDQRLEELCRNLPHLISLYRVLLAQLLSGFNDAVKIYQNYIDVLGGEVEKYRQSSFMLPAAFNDLPNYPGFKEPLMVRKGSSQQGHYNRNRNASKTRNNTGRQMDTYDVKLDDLTDNGIVDSTLRTGGGDAHQSGYEVVGVESDECVIVNSSAALTLMDDDQTLCIDGSTVSLVTDELVQSKCISVLDLPSANDDSISQPTSAENDDKSFRGIKLYKSLNDIVEDIVKRLGDPNSLITRKDEAELCSLVQKRYASKQDISEFNKKIESKYNNTNDTDPDKYKGISVQDLPTSPPEDEAGRCLSIGNQTSADSLPRDDACSQEDINNSHTQAISPQKETGVLFTCVSGEPVELHYASDTAVTRFDESALSGSLVRQLAVRPKVDGGESGSSSNDDRDPGDDKTCNEYVRESNSEDEHKVKKLDAKKQDDCQIKESTAKNPAEPRTSQQNAMDNYFSEFEKE